MSPGESSIRLLLSSKLEGKGFGVCTYKIYEATAGLDESQSSEAPYFFVWLHGADNGDIDAAHLEKMQQRLRRKTIFMVPLNPKASQKGLHFSWGVSHTKAQNKNCLGFVFGSLNEDFLYSLTSKISELSSKCGAERVVVAGYSMGGFGAYQLGGFAPDTFDAVISVAGYGRGTREASNRGYGAPQPQSSEIFQDFLDSFVGRLAYVPIVIAAHSRNDTISCFDDDEAIVDAIDQQGKGGVVKFIEVPDDLANSDPGRKKKTKHGHNYFNYTLLNDTSEELLWEPLLAAFATERYRRETEVPCP